MYLDFIRNHISIVRKISPTIANDLETRANEFEKIAPPYFNMLIEKNALMKNQRKVLSDKNYLIKLMDEEKDDLKNGIKNKERYPKIESLLKESKDEDIILEKKTIDLKEKHQRIESQMVLCIIRLHDYVMMISKSIIDTLDYLKGEKADVDKPNTSM